MLRWGSNDDDFGIGHVALTFVLMKRYSMVHENEVGYSCQDPDGKATGFKGTVEVIKKGHELQSIRCPCKIAFFYFS